METILQDLRYGLRMLRKSPGFTAVAVITLALGIGANTAIFSVVYGVLLRPLPYPHPERVVQLCESDRHNLDEKDLTYSGFQFLQTHAVVFQSMAVFTNVGFNLAIHDTTEHVNGLHVSSDYFRILGANPLIGRTFSAEEDSGYGVRVAILSAGLWKRMGSDPHVLGQTIQLDGAPYTVIGVISADFERLNTPLTHGETDIWAPAALVARTVGSGQNLAAIGRLKEGVSLEQARSQMSIISDEFRRVDHELDPGSQLDLRPYQTMLSSEFRTILWVLFGAVAFVLLIACANLANLLLGRAVGRTKEMALRAALGGSRARLFRQLITESLLLSILGAFAGVALASWGLRLILAFSPIDLPRANDIKLDSSAFAFAFALSVITGLGFGLVPALRARRRDLNDALKEGTTRTSPGRRPALFRSTLAVAEIGLALVLLTGATLLTETLWRVLQTDPGFDPTHVLAMEVWLNGSKYDSSPAVANFYESVVQRIERLPGVQSAAVVAAGLPLERGGNVGVGVAGTEIQNAYDFRMITPGYFRTMGIPLKQGRLLEAADNEHGAPVVVVSESLAQRLFPNKSAIGERIIDGGSDSPREIVGVVGDVRSYLDRPAQPAVFVPFAQTPFATMKLFESWLATRIVVRTAADPLMFSRSLQAQLHAADPAVAMGRIRTMEEVRSAAVATRQFNMTLLVLLAALAAALAAIGIYGVMAYTVRQRTHEIGVRMALGAQRAEILGMIYREGLLLAICGIAIGTACALGLTRLLQSYLYEVTPRDPVAFIATGAVLGLVAILACTLPALRATKVDPVVALRYE
jgi:predicted permease